VWRDEQPERRFAEHPFDDDLRIEPFHEFAEQVEVLLIAKHAEWLPRVFGSQCGPTHDVQVVDLDCMYGGAGHFVRHRQPLLERFPGEPKDEMCSDMKRSAACHFHCAQEGAVIMAAVNAL